MTTGSGNIGVGTDALRRLDSGANNVAIGNDAGHNATGSNNVFIGNGAGYNYTGDNKLYISNGTSTDLITGFFNTGDLYLGQTSGTVTIKNDADIDGTLTLGSLSDVESSIGTNTSNISTNSSNISTNSSITSNDNDIATNATNISSNDSDISTLQTVTSNITSGARLYQGGYQNLTTIGTDIIKLLSRRYI